MLIQLTAACVVFETDALNAYWSARSFRSSSQCASQLIDEIHNDNVPAEFVNSLGHFHPNHLRSIDALKHGIERSGFQRAVAAGRRKVEVIGQGAAADTVPK